MQPVGMLNAFYALNRIVQTEINEKNIQWVFSEITATSFRWQRMVKCPDDTWETEAELFAVRR